MRHGVKGKKFNRPRDERESMYRNMIQSLFEKERIVTTLAKAKAVKPLAEKLITKGKKQTLAAMRDLSAFFYKEDVAYKVYHDLAVRFKDREGGYLRIFHLGPRISDGSQMAILELVDRKEMPKKEKTLKSNKKTSHKKTASPQKASSKEAISENSKETKKDK